MKRSTKFSPQIRFVMTDKLPHDLCEDWGGCMYFRKSKDPRRKDAYCWDVHKEKQVRLLLQKVRPYLRVKHTQADLALHALDVLDKKVEGWQEKIRYLTEELHKFQSKGPRRKL